MTNEQAIKWLLYERDNIDTEGYCGTKENYARIKALDMAIEALQQEKCSSCQYAIAHGERETE